MINENEPENPKIISISDKDRLKRILDKINMNSIYEEIKNEQ